MVEDENKLYLNEHWDAIPHIDNFYNRLKKKQDEPNPTYHVTRTKELESLSDFINGRNEEALLISGRRGFGKTSLVHTALIKEIEAGTQKDGKIVLPVLIDAPSIELPDLYKNVRVYSSETQSKLKKIMIKSLARGLYLAYSQRCDLILNYINRKKPRGQEEFKSV